MSRPWRGLLHRNEQPVAFLLARSVPKIRRLARAIITSQRDVDMLREAAGFDRAFMEMMIRVTVARSTSPRSSYGTARTLV